MNNLMIKIPQYVMCERTPEKDTLKPTGGIITKSYTSQDNTIELVIYPTHKNSRQFGSMEYIFSSKEKNIHVFQSNTDCNRIYTATLPKDDPIMIQTDFGDTFIMVPYSNELLFI